MIPAASESEGGKATQSTRGIVNVLTHDQLPPLQREIIPSVKVLDEPSFGMLRLLFPIY